MSDPDRAAGRAAKIFYLVLDDIPVADHRVLSLMSALADAGLLAEGRLVTDEIQAVLDSLDAWWLDPDEMQDPFDIDAGKVEANASDRLFRAAHAYLASREGR